MAWNGVRFLAGCSEWGGCLGQMGGYFDGVKIAGTGGVRAEVEPLRTRLTLSRGEL